MADLAYRLDAAPAGLIVTVVNVDEECPCATIHVWRDLAGGVHIHLADAEQTLGDFTLWRGPPGAVV